MTPVYRTRNNFSSIYGLVNRNYVMREYLNGTKTWQWASTLSSTYPPDANYIKDEIHMLRRRGTSKGRYPPGYVFHQHTDLSRCVSCVDFDELDAGKIYNCRWDGTPPPLLPPSGGMEYFIGAASALPGFFDFRVPSAIVNALSEEAWNYFSDVLPQCLSFSEFTQGFLQLKDLCPTIGESITGTLTGGYLNKSFGWDNLLADLETLGGLFERTIARMDYFRRTYGIPQRLGFSRRIGWTPDSLNAAFGSTLYPKRFAINPVTGVSVELIEFRAIFRATTWITQTLDYMQDLVGFLRVMAGELGLNNPVKAIWNVIPLSFVVDWFFKIDTHLDGLTRISPPIGWNIDDVTQSVSYDFTFKLTQYSSMDPRGSNYPLKSWVVPVKVYERQPNLSYHWELLNPNDLSPTQLTLLAAMLHQFSGG